MASNRREQFALVLKFFPQSSDSAEDMAGLIDVYEYALQGVSDLNVTTSVAAFIQGEVRGRNNAFRPSPAELAEYARAKQMRDDEHAKAVARNHQRFQITHEKPPELSEAERRAHVEAILGRKVDKTSKVNRPAMTAADRKRPKPWLKPEVLRASMARIEAHLEADGVPLHPKEADFIDKHNPEDRNK